MAPRCGSRERVRHGVQLEGLVFQCMQGGGGQRRQLVDPLGRVGRLGLADILVMEEKLIDGRRADDLTRGRGHGAGHRQELLQSLDVDGEDPVDRLARVGLPHAGGERAVDVELWGQPQVSPIDSGEGICGLHIGQMELPVAGRDDPGLEEGPGARAHLGVVACQEQVRPGPLQNGCGGRRGVRRAGQCRLHLVQIVQKSVVDTRQRADKTLCGSQIDAGQLCVGGCGQRGELLEGFHAVRPGRVGQAEQ